MTLQHSPASQLASTPVALIHSYIQSGQIRRRRRRYQTMAFIWQNMEGDGQSTTAQGC